MRRVLRRTVILPTVAVIAVIAVVALWFFQPWRAFTNTTVDEAVPLATSAPSARPPLLLEQGVFLSHEHHTEGVVKILDTGGRRVLRLEGLNTSDGPALHVWLASARTVGGPAGWTVFDKGKYLDLGPLKGNHGNQNYDVPAGTQLSDYQSVSIWCARFHVSFGAAPLSRI